MKQSQNAPISPGLWASGMAELIGVQYVLAFGQQMHTHLGVKLQPACLQVCTT